MLSEIKYSSATLQITADHRNSWQDVAFNVELQSTANNAKKIMNDKNIFDHHHYDHSSLPRHESLLGVLAITATAAAYAHAVCF